jgi:hypothetical protein
MNKVEPLPSLGIKDASSSPIPWGKKLHTHPQVSGVLLMASKIPDSRKFERTLKKNPTSC